jgi:Cu/Zn superoxide dismutase
VVEESRARKATLTDVVVKAHQSSGELALVLHDDPDGAADTPVDELEGQDGGRHGCGCDCCDEGVWALRLGVEEQSVNIVT